MKAPKMKMGRRPIPDNEKKVKITVWVKKKNVSAATNEINEALKKIPNE